MTAGQRRRAVVLLQETFRVSQRRACRVLGQHRSTQRKSPRAKEGEGLLVKRMLEMVGLHPRFGYRRIWALLRREGWEVNRKRVYRLWRSQGLKVPRKKRKKRRLGHGGNGCVRRRAEYRGHVWAWDFIHDRTSDGRPLKWLTVVDEFTRECVALVVGRGMTASGVAAVMTAAVAESGSPAHIRSDNGPEFIAKAIRAWMASAEVTALYIEPGSPWENGYAESFNSKVRDELLNVEEFSSLPEARALGKEWRRSYDHERPHSSLGYMTPAEFGRKCPRADSAKPSPARGHICND